MMANERGKCNRQEPRNFDLRKLNFEAKSYFSRKLIPSKISCYTVFFHSCTCKAPISRKSTVAPSNAGTALPVGRGELEKKKKNSALAMI